MAALAALTAIAVHLGIERPIDRIRRPSPATPHDATREPSWVKALLAVYLIAPFAMLAAIVA